MFQRSMFISTLFSLLLISAVTVLSFNLVAILCGAVLPSMMFFLIAGLTGVNMDHKQKINQAKRTYISSMEKLKSQHPNSPWVYIPK